MMPKANRAQNLQFYRQTFGTNCWTGYQPITRPLSMQDNTKKRHRHIHILCGIPTLDPNVQAVKDSTCLKYTATLIGKHKRSGIRNM